jgi:gamma-glutamylcyclotransferase (GGCT)/AIG2-like uncharacterized protein YtfP
VPADNGGVSRLFVYGTLRLSFSHPAANRLHQRGLYLGTGIVRGELQDCGAYPGLTRGEGQVRGDVYRVGPLLLRYLDAFEGDQFRRERMTARMDGGGVVNVWVYLLR